MGFAHDVPLRQPVLPGAERRRARQALSGEGQLLDRPRHAHDQGRRRVAAHEQRAGLPRLLRGPLHLRQRDRLPALHVAGGAGRLRTEHRRLLERLLRDRAGQRVPAGTTTTGGPLLFYLQSSSPDGIARDEAGASDINNEEFALFVQDKWQVGHGLTVDYGLRWDAQLMPDTVDPPTTAYAPFLNDPRFPSDGTIPEPDGSSFSRAAASPGTSRENGKSVVRGSAGIYYARQNMLSQVGSVTTNGIQQKSDFRDSRSRRSPTCRCGRTCCRRAPCRRARSRSSPASACSTATTRTRASTASTSGSSASWRRASRCTSTSPSRRATHLTRFLNYNVHGTAAAATQPPTRDTTTYTGANPFEPQLGDVFVTNSRGHGLYRGAHVRRPQALLAAAISSKRTTCSRRIEDDDSNERDPFTDRSFNFYDLDLDYGPSDRDIRHKFNFFTYAELPRQFLLERPHPGTHGAADHDLAARAERQRSRPQLGSQGQRVLLARLAAAAAVHVRRRGRRSSRASRCSTRSTTPTTSTR